jgi:hypothetical protein
MKRLIVLGVLGLFVFAAVVAVRSLPWWALALGAVLLGLLGKYIVVRLVRKLFLMPFRAKGTVLKGASAHVHRISPNPAPSLPTESGAEVDRHEQYLLEVTITPVHVEGPFGMWEPGELRLVRAESVLRPESDEPDDVDDTCEVAKIQVEDEGQWSEDEGMMYTGPQRLRLSLAVRPGTRELNFRYYFEEFGSIRLLQAKAVGRS